MKTVCKSILGNICSMGYTAAGQKFEDTVLPLLGRNLGQNHHIYQENFYNSARLAKTLLERKGRVSGTMKATRGRLT
jgi:hypothetical protein